MTKLSWDESSLRRYNAGISHGVFYPQTGPGVAWNGLLSVDETEEVLQQTVRYFDGQKFYNQLKLDSYAATVNAFTYPDEFLEYDGYSDLATQQARRSTFGLSYRNNRELHLVYNALASPTSSAFSSQTESPELVAFSWNLTTTPIQVPDANPSAHFVIDLDQVDPNTLMAMEIALYGIDGVEPYLPMPEEVLFIFEASAILRIIDHGDGTWSAIGPELAIQLLNSTTFEITWPSAEMIDSVSYTISSL